MENSASRTWRGVWRGALAALVAALAVGSGYAFWFNSRFKKEGVETMGVVTRIYTKTEYRTRRVTRRTSRREKVTIHYLDWVNYVAEAFAHFLAVSEDVAMGNHVLRER